MKVRTTLANGTLLLASTLVTLLLVELGFRVTGIGERPQRFSEPIERFDPVLGWSKRPDISVTIRTDEYETVETINSRGLRGPEVAIPKPQGTRRILLLGDSFLEGQAVSDDEVVARVLEDRLRSRADGEDDIEVVNAGTVGWSTDQELLFFREHGVHYEPDVTVLQFYVNDVWWNAQDDYRGNPKPRFVPRDEGSVELVTGTLSPPEERRSSTAVAGGSAFTRAVRRVSGWLADHSNLYLFARSRLLPRGGGGGLGSTLGVGPMPVEWRGWWKDPDAETREAWRVTEALIVALRDEAAVSGSAFVVFYVPSFWAVHDEAWERLTRRYDIEEAEWSPVHDATVLDSICERHGLDCVIPIDAFREAAGEPGPGGLYYETDVHWTPRGHALAAEILARRLSGLAAFRSE
ncbi:MAG: SGNH/GDSL hydrolase family protein [Gemmatimonadota bacterium]|nr:SGNH/GDSL hydrolase family protein [Gemmatimonadota bacterium]